MLFGNACGLLGATFNATVNQVRTRISCSKYGGKEKSVKTAMQRFFRIEDKLWIRAAPGFHHRLWTKSLDKRSLLQQSYIVGKTQSLMLERMAGRFYKKIKLDYFVEPPFSLYQPFMNQKKWSEEHLNKQRFFP